jgi:hypothetical protein
MEFAGVVAKGSVLTIDTMRPPRLVLLYNTNPDEASFVPDRPPKLLCQMMPSNPCAGVVGGRGHEFIETMQVVMGRYPGQTKARQS